MAYHRMFQSRVACMLAMYGFRVGMESTLKFLWLHIFVVVLLHYDNYGHKLGRGDQY